jgi:hypothetical protein
MTGNDKLVSCGHFAVSDRAVQAQLFRAPQHCSDTDRVGPAQLTDRFDFGINAALAQR